ncbi:MAG TPA: DUF1284 domain-containing protein [Thermodesulfovibrionales bacterium]|nr:DUF1284 domain-containing protein [Thermodesulfovibrionales bacterium]
MLERAAQGEQIEVVSGPDDVCEKCHFLKVGRCLFNANADEEIRKMDEAAVLLQRTKKNEVVSWRDMRENLPLVFNSWFKKYCGVCEWRQSCEKEEEFRSMSDMGAP